MRYGREYSEYGTEASNWRQPVNLLRGDIVQGDKHDTSRVFL